MVLTWIEPSTPAKTYKWLSADKEMLATKAGRIVKTINLKAGNLSAIIADQSDPLALNILRPDAKRTWSYKLSWSPGYHRQYSATSRFSIVGKETISHFERALELVHVSETVSLTEIDFVYTNHFWLSPSSGEVVKSQQHPYPGADTINLLLPNFFIGSPHG